MAIGRLNIGLTGVQPGGLAKVIPSSVAVGSGTGSADTTGTITFTGTSSVSLNDIFSSKYTNYRLMIRFTSGSASAQVGMRFRVSNADDSSNAYRRAGYYSGLETSIGAIFSNTLSTTYFLGDYINGAYPFYCTLDINQPYETLQKNIICNSVANSGVWTGVHQTGVFTNSTSFTGLTVYGTSGNFTGTITAYGYN